MAISAWGSYRGAMPCPSSRRWTRFFIWTTTLCTERSQSRDPGPGRRSIFSIPSFRNGETSLAVTQTSWESPDILSTTPGHWMRQRMWCAASTDKDSSCWSTPAARTVPGSIWGRMATGRPSLPWISRWEGWPRPAYEMMFF